MTNALVVVHVKNMKDKLYFWMNFSYLYCYITDKKSEKVEEEQL